MKHYLGDGAYVDFDGYALILTTENGIRTTNTIVLEPEVYTALVRWVEQLKNRAHSHDCAIAVNSRHDCSCGAEKP